MVVLSFVLFLLGPVTVRAAEYNGHDIDGETYDGQATSSGTGHTYSVRIEFSSDEATITFSNGGSRTITLDDEEIDDPHDISGTDSDGVTWDLDVDGLD